MFLKSLNGNPKPGDPEPGPYPLLPPVEPETPWPRIQQSKPVTII
jgi:hypothetical protein